jgi:hypothetical protein
MHIDKRWLLWGGLLAAGLLALGGWLIARRHALEPADVPEAQRILDVQAQTPFQILIPTYLPKQFNRSNVDITANELGPGGEPLVRLTYHTRTGEIVVIRQWVPAWRLEETVVVGQWLPVARDPQVPAASQLAHTKWGQSWLLRQGGDLITIWVDVGPLRVEISTSDQVLLPVEQLLAVADNLGPASSHLVFSTAATEATAIVRQAWATALLREAVVTGTPRPGATGSLPGAGLTPPPTVVSSQRTPGFPAAAASSAPGAVETVPVASSTPEVLGVTLAIEDKYITILFDAPPKVAQEWGQGRVSVVDEATGTVYSEIPIIPNAGPLIAVPLEDWQVGHVALVNAPIPLSTGALVTVVLGEYRFEHLTIQ